MKRATGNRKITKHHQTAAMMAEHFRLVADFNRFAAVRILECYGARLPNRWGRSLIAHIQLLVTHMQAREWIDGSISAVGGCQHQPALIGAGVTPTIQARAVLLLTFNWTERHFMKGM